MPYETEVFGWTRPTPASVSDEDENRWADILAEESIPDFERSLVVHGPFADRPVSPPFDVLYHAHDRGVTYHYDSTAGTWDQVSTERYDLTAGMDEADVRGTVNDAPAGASFAVDPGASWVLSGPLTLKEGIKLIGHDHIGKRPATFRKAFDGALVSMHNDVELENLVFDGNRSQGWSGTVLSGDPASSNRGGARWRVHKCDVINGAADGIYASCYLSEFSACRFTDNGGFGIRFPETDGENPHNAITGPTAISRNDAGGIAIDNDGKNTRIHAYLGHNGGPGIHATGAWRATAITAHFAANDGPAYLQQGGNMAVTFDSCLFQANAQAPATGLTAPVGEFQIESGAFDGTFVAPTTENVTQLITAPTNAASSVVMQTPATRPVEGDIEGATLRLVVADAAALTGSVDVASAVALDTAAADVLVGPTLSESIGGAATATKATLTGDVSISDSSWTTVPFDGAAYGGANLDTATGIYTVPEDGVYRFVGNVRFDATVQGAAYATRAHPGPTSDAIIPRQGRTGDGDTVYFHYDDSSLASAGETVLLEVYQNSGAAATLNKNTSLAVVKETPTP